MKHDLLTILIICYKKSTFDPFHKYVLKLQHENEQRPVIIK